MGDELSLFFTREITENLLVGTQIGILDQDELIPNNDVNYSLIDDAGGLFSLDSETGIITLERQLNYESAPNHEITVVATNTDGSTNTADFTINVLNVDEYDLYISEDSPIEKPLI